MRPIDADELMIRIRDKASPIDIISKGYMGVSVLSVGEIGRTVDGMPSLDGVQAREWISVGEGLPEYEGSYLVCTANSGAFIGHYYAQSKSFTGGRGHITHWMDRPESPKMEEGSNEL